MIQTNTIRIAQSPMTLDEQMYSKRLGTRIAAARHEADLTQAQLAAALGISQPQLAFYEVGKRRVPVSMLPRLARLLNTSVEMLLDEAEATQPLVQSRSRRGPPSRLEQQLERITHLPKARQRMMSEVIDAMLAQHTAQHVG